MTSPVTTDDIMDQLLDQSRLPVNPFEPKYVVAARLRAQNLLVRVLRTPDSLGRPTPEDVANMLQLMQEDREAALRAEASGKTQSEPL